MDDLIKVMIQQAPCVVALMYLLFRSDKRVDMMVGLLVNLVNTLSNVVKTLENSGLGDDVPKPE